jgi:hypothetical protein
MPTQRRRGRTLGAGQATHRSRGPRFDTIVARLVAIGPDGEPWVGGTEAGLAQSARARSTIGLGPAMVGREVLLCFAGPQRTPVVVGLLFTPGDGMASAPAPTVDLVVDRRRIVLEARQEVILRCGKAAIRLGADGKVYVQGADVVSSAARVNRIRGGAVKIN